jgi:OmpA-OmpF porin, OOP family
MKGILKALGKTKSALRSKTCFKPRAKAQPGFSVDVDQIKSIVGVRRVGYTFDKFISEHQRTRLAMTRQGLVASVALAVALALPTVNTASAQSSSGMTAEEITQAFEKQKTRGLVLVPSDSAATAPATTSTTTVAAADPAKDYIEVDKADQVNIQIKFDFDSATLRDDQKTQLDTLCQVMKAVDVKVFQIVGHTDSSGSASYNESLSLLRAKEVKRHLVNECGIAETRLEAIGMGEAAPFNSADPRADENRRVEFQALG